MKPATFTDATFEAEVISSDRPVLVDVGANWCGPCRLIDPILKELAVEYAGRLKVGKMDFVPLIRRRSDTAFKACRPCCSSRMEM